MSVSFDYHTAHKEFEILWQHYALSSEVKFPFALSSSHFDPIDEIFVAIYAYLSTLLVQPSYTFAIAGILSEVAAVHTGLNSGLLDFITLRFLSGRADICLHDHHHMCSDNHMRGRNFGHFLWIWDYAFGSLAVKESKKAV